MTSLQTLLTDENLRLIRQKLTVFFARRNCRNVEELVDETIYRVGIAIVKAADKGEELQMQASASAPSALHTDASTDDEANPVVGNLAKYFFGVAKNILLEHYRQLERLNKEDSLEELLERHVEFTDPAPDTTEDEQQELRLACLRTCLQKFPAGEQEMIVGYYGSDETDNEKSNIENRKAWAARLSISVKALRSLALRRRRALEICVRECLKKK